MQRRQKSFWGPAVLTLGLILVLKFFHLDARIPFLDQLLADQGPPGIIALLVLGFTLFCLLRLIAWRIATIRMMQIIRLAQQALEASQANQSRSPFQSVDPISQIQVALGQYYENSILKQRLQLAQKRLAEPERALSLMSSQSGIDDSSLQNAYGPIRALIWALPAFGFMGTAFEMAGAVGGLGVALSQTQDYNGLRNLLVNQVVPHLASAFNITIFALGCSVVCFILLSWVHAREQTTLLEADALSLQILADKQSPTGPPPSLPAELQALIQHLQTLNTTLTSLQQGGGVGSLIPLLQKATNSLEAIREGFDQDMTITRSSRSNGGAQP